MIIADNVYDALVKLKYLSVRCFKGLSSNVQEEDKHSTACSNCYAMAFKVQISQFKPFMIK